MIAQNNAELDNNGANWYRALFDTTWGINTDMVGPFKACREAFCMHFSFRGLFGE
jgi:hypothetical protein